MLAGELGWGFASAEVQGGGITVLGVTELDGIASSRLGHPDVVSLATGVPP